MTVLLRSLLRCGANGEGFAKAVRVSALRGFSSQYPRDWRVLNHFSSWLAWYPQDWRKVISASGALGTGEDSVISAPGILGTACRCSNLTGTMASTLTTFGRLGLDVQRSAGIRLCQ